MAKAIRDITKAHERKRVPSTGEPVLVRLQAEMAQLIDDWRRREADIPGRPEAIRRLVELGLLHRPLPAGKPHRGAAKAHDMAKDVLNDQIAHLPDEERNSRKRRLLKV